MLQQFFGFGKKQHQQQQQQQQQHQVNSNNDNDDSDNVIVAPKGQKMGESNPTQDMMCLKGSGGDGGGRERENSNIFPLLSKSKSDNISGWGNTNPNNNNGDGSDDNKNDDGLSQQIDRGRFIFHTLDTNVDIDWDNSNNNNNDDDDCCDGGEVVNRIDNDSWEGGDDKDEDNEGEGDDDEDDGDDDDDDDNKYNTKSESNNRNNPQSVSPCESIQHFHRKVLSRKNSLSDHIISNNHDTHTQERLSFMTLVQDQLTTFSQNLEKEVVALMQHNRELISRQSEQQITTFSDTLSQYVERIDSLSNRIKILEQDVLEIKERMNEEKEMLKDGMDLLRLKNQYIRRNVLFPFLPEHCDSSPLVNVLDTEEGGGEGNGLGSIIPPHTNALGEKIAPPQQQQQQQQCYEQNKENHPSMKLPMSFLSTQKKK
jgi:hypothetical protein